MEKKYVVYIHTNMINNKVYIGITCQKPEYRWHKDGSGYKDNQHFWKAIQKYGWENFRHDIVFKGLTKEQACETEIKLIKEKRANNAEFGYNIGRGGEGIDPEITATLWKRKGYRKFASERMREAWKDVSKRKRRSNAAKERWSDPDFKSKVRESIKQSCRSSVKCVETGETFSNICDAENKYNLNHSNICRAIRTGYKCGGYHWAYLDDVS